MAHKVYQKAMEKGSCPRCGASEATISTFHFGATYQAECAWCGYGRITRDEAWLAKNNANPIISSFLPSLFIEVLLIIVSLNLFIAFFVIGVLKKPGAIAFTITLFSIAFFANCLVNIITPALLELYNEP